MLMKEYRICMPLTVEEYRIGQLYMISRHSSEQSHGGEGVEVICNEPQTHPQHGLGQFTEKRIHLSSKLPSWIKMFVPRIFYITEKAWNFYPYTITEFTCSFFPKFHIRIETRFENNNGNNDNAFEDIPTPKESVIHLDILSDKIPEKHYEQKEDLSSWRSAKTGRGPLRAGWRNESLPVMCSYKRVECSFEVYGLQGKTEEFIHKNIRDILLVGHRQAVAWTDEWHGMTLEDVRRFEKELQEQTNNKLKSAPGRGEVSNSAPRISRSVSVADELSLKKMGVVDEVTTDSSRRPQSPMRVNSTPK
ncbi:cytoplasmic phosphatidylinositol transfer protein 1b [Scleropages formosus]|uniref:cytoplasmic phosphatidylinositol transfer protein 1b n=1 Tax=Scleropages formosus TaxID=113540 RepID=UPI0008790145|nr:cytoplasmic phosphatidylinositol transfer protein 1-like [Scleropages formosus]